MAALTSGPQAEHIQQLVLHSRIWRGAAFMFTLRA